MGKGEQLLFSFGEIGEKGFARKRRVKTDTGIEASVTKKVSAPKKEGQSERLPLRSILIHPI
jgi:hypothetical protein